MQGTFENKIFEKRPRKSYLDSFLCMQLLFMDKIMKNKKAGLYLSCRTCLEKFLFWSNSLNLETVERKGKKRQNIEYLKNEKAFLEEIKTIFQNFSNAFYW